MLENSEVSLLQALSECYNFKSKSKEILFEVVFNDVSRTIKFGKHWHKVLKRYEYFIHETHCPCLGCTEEGFVSNLSNCSGISTGFCNPNYKVYKRS